VRLSRDQLIFRALVILDEVVDACGAAPIRPSLGARFALMFLYAVSNGDRHAYDDFWRVVEDRQEHTHSETMGSTMRETNARTCLTGIACSVGVDFSVEYQRELRIARMPADERAILREREATLAQHQRRLRDDGWQYEAKDYAKADREKAGG
jgi:hypothetical protein